MLTCCCTGGKCYLPCCIYSWDFRLNFFVYAYWTSEPQQYFMIHDWAYQLPPSGHAGPYTRSVQNAIKSSFTDWYETDTSNTLAGAGPGTDIDLIPHSSGTAGGSRINMVLGQPVDPEELWENPNFPLHCDFRFRFYPRYNWASPADPPDGFGVIWIARPTLTVNRCSLNFDSLSVLSSTNLSIPSLGEYLEDVEDTWAPETDPESSWAEWLYNNTSPALTITPNPATDGIHYNDNGDEIFQSTYADIVLRATWRGIDHSSCYKLCTDEVDDTLRKERGSGARCWIVDGDAPSPVPSFNPAYGLQVGRPVADFDVDTVPDLDDPECSNPLCLCNCNYEECRCDGGAGATSIGGTSGFNVAYPIEGAAGASLNYEFTGTITAYAMVFDGTWPYLVGQVRLFLFPATGSGPTLTPSHYGVIVSLWGHYTDDSVSAFDFTGWVTYIMRDLPGEGNGNAITQDLFAQCTWTEFIFDFDENAPGEPIVSASIDGEPLRQGNDAALRPSQRGNNGGVLPDGDSYTFEPLLRGAKWYHHAWGLK